MKSQTILHILALVCFTQSPSLAWASPEDNISSLSLDEAFPGLGADSIDDGVLYETCFQEAVTVFQYRMTVEWDQRDPKIQNQIVNEFKMRLNTLFSRGMTVEEAFRILAKLANDPQSTKDLNATADLVKKHLLNLAKAIEMIARYVLEGLKTGTQIQDG